MNDTMHEEKTAMTDNVNTGPSQNPPKRKGGVVRKALRWAGFSLAGVAALGTVSIGGGLIFLRSDAGEGWLTSSINGALSALPSGLSGSISSFTGPLPSSIRLSELVLRDKHGEWLKADAALLKISWKELPKAFVVSEIALEKPVLLRVPDLEASETPEATPTAPTDPKELLIQLGNTLKNWPSWLPELRVDELALRSATVTKEVMPYPFTATLLASASAGNGGINSTIHAIREDGSLPKDALNRRASLAVSLVPDLDLTVNADLSDLGFAAQALSATFSHSPALLLSLKGSAPIENWKTQIKAAMYDVSMANGATAANTMLRLNGQAEASLFSDSPRTHTTLTVTSGDLSHALWALTGQKNGNFAISVDAAAEIGKKLDAAARVDIKLADMEWGSPLLQNLLGSTVSAGTSLTAVQDSGLTTLHLEKLFAAAAHIDTMTAGRITLAGHADLADSASRTELQGKFNLIDAAQLSPELSGDIAATLNISGPFSALAAHASLAGSRLQIPEYTVEDVNITLDLPSVDIPTLMTRQHKKSSDGKPDLIGSFRAAMQANAQPVDISADWKLFTAPQGQLDFAMDGLKLNAAGNTVQGALIAKIPPAAHSPKKGSLEAMLGASLPRLDGNLAINVSNWEGLSTLAGLQLKGQPLKASLRLFNSSSQNMELSADLAQLTVPLAEKTLAITNADIAMSADDMWGKPHANITLSADALNAAPLMIGPAKVTVDGGLDELNAEMRTDGSIVSDIKAQWKPGRLFLERLEAQLLPSLFDSANGEAVGLSLTEPITLKYSADSVEIPAMSARLLPAGSLEMSGLWAPESLQTTLQLLGVGLENYRHIVPELPSGDLSLTADFTGTLPAPKGNFKLNLKNVAIPGASLPAMDADLSGNLSMQGKQRTLHIQMNAPEQTLQALGLNSFGLDADIPFTSPKSGVSQPDMKAPLRADLLVDGQLEGIWKLVPAADQRMSGKISLDASVTGSASTPVVTAHAALENGTFTDIMQGVELRDIQLKADADNFDLTHKRAKDKITLSLSASDGRKGGLAVNGWLDPSTMNLDVDGKFENLSPLHRQDVRILLNGSLDVAGSVQSPVVTADVSIDKGEVQLASLPGGNIPTLEIWTPENEAEKTEQSPVPGRLDVRLRIPNQFFVRGYGLDSEWKGGLLIKGPLDRPAVSGQLQAVRGSLDILGKNFKLAEGQIRFDGGWPVSPLLNIDMEYVASGITANILVGGTASDPKLTLTSQPELPQDEILSQIMFGESSGSLSHVQALQLAAGAASLAGFGGPGVMNMGREILGVDVFKLNSDNDGSGSDVSRTSLEMGTYVRDNIYVGVEQGIGRESDTGAVVEIELLPRLEAQVRASGSDTEIGLEWKKNY